MPKERSGDGGSGSVPRRRSRSGAEPERGRWSSRKKTEVVLRLLRGETLDALSRELKVSTAKISEWRDAFLEAGQQSLKTRPQAEEDSSAQEIQRLRAKIGEMTMDRELFDEFVKRVDPKHRPPLRKLKP